MSVTVFYVPFKVRGSTESLFKIAKEKTNGIDFSKILYLAPTIRKVRDSQQKLHRLSGKHYIPPDMMTLRQLSKRLFSLYEERKCIPQAFVPLILSHISSKGIGFASVIANFISEMKQYYPSVNIDSLKVEIKAVFQELGIPEDVSKRTYEAIDIYKEYQDILIRNALADENDIINICPQLLARHKHIHNILIIDGFFHLTKAEEEIIKILIENTDETLISIPYDNNYSFLTDTFITFLNNNFKLKETYFKSCFEPNIFSCSFSSTEEEIENIARDIKFKYFSGTVSELENIVVTFPNINNYYDIVDRVFKKYGIPFIMSTSKPLAKTRPFLDLLALADSIAEEFPRLSFSRFLISPHFNKIPSVFREYIPRLCLRSGLVKGKDSWLNLPKSVGVEQSMLSEPQTSRIISDIEKGLKRIFKKLFPLESIKNKGNYSLYCKTIVEILNDLDFSDDSNPSVDLKNLSGEILNELSFMDDLKRDSPIYDSLNLSLFTDGLKYILNSFSIEPEGTGIQILGFQETQGIEPEYLYFGGLKDGDLPYKPDIDHLLPDSIKTRLGLPNLNTSISLQKFAFYRLTGASKAVQLSYPMTDGDRFFLPSPLLPWNSKSKKQIYGIFSPEEKFVKKGITPFSKHIKEIDFIDKKFLTSRFGEKRFIRVTDIDAYRACPRRFYIEKMLNLEPLEIKKYEVEAVILGTIAHEIMQELITETFSSLDEFRLKAIKILNKVLSNKVFEEYWKNVFRKTFLSILPDIYAIEKGLKNEGYSFMSAEVTVEGEILKGIKLRGKIDRIDKLSVPALDSSNNLVVELIDYKTGSTQFFGQQVLKKGTMLQLFLYAALIELHGGKVNRVGIYSLKDLNISWIPGKQDEKSGRTISDYVKASLGFLEESLSKMRKGDFSAQPLNEQTCRNCHDRPYCPYIQKGSLDHGKLS